MIKPLTIGHLARAARVNIETVRYYEPVGLVQKPRKPLQGFREYPAATVDRIRFIKRAQPLGFSLQELAELLELGDGHCADVRARAEEKRAHISQQIKDLRKLQKTLDTLIGTCKADNDAIHCPIVEALAGKR